MGCLKLSYYNYERALDKRPVFSVMDKEKNASGSEICKDYYAGGMLMPGRSFNASNYRFGFNGKEKDDEWTGNTGSHIDLGDRYLDTRLCRTFSMDSKAGKYPFISPYAFAINNPINAIDPDGKDVYLIVWKSKENETGHAAIAVDNYKKQEKKVIENGKEITKTTWVKDGTVTYYDLWPEKPVGQTELQTNVTPDYNKRTLTKETILNGDPSPSGERGKVSEYGEGKSPDGIVQISTSAKVDEAIKTYLDAVQAIDADYNASSNNCSTFSGKVFKVLDKTFDASQLVKPPSPLNLMYKDARVIAPNNLFNKVSLLKGAKVLKGPAQLEAKPYLQYFGKDNRTN